MNKIQPFGLGNIPSKRPRYVKKSNHSIQEMKSSLEKASDTALEKSDGFISAIQTANEPIESASEAFIKYVECFSHSYNEIFDYTKSGLGQPGTLIKNLPKNEREALLELEGFAEDQLKTALNKLFDRPEITKLFAKFTKTNLKEFYAALSGDKFKIDSNGKSQIFLAFLFKLEKENPILMAEIIPGAQQETKQDELLKFLAAGETRIESETHKNGSEQQDQNIRRTIESRTVSVPRKSETNSVRGESKTFEETPDTLPKAVDEFEELKALGIDPNLSAFEDIFGLEGNEPDLGSEFGALEQDFSNAFSAELNPPSSTDELGSKNRDFPVDISKSLNQLVSTMGIDENFSLDNPFPEFDYEMEDPQVEDFPRDNEKPTEFGKIAALSSSERPLLEEKVSGLGREIKLSNTFKYEQIIDDIKSIEHEYTENRRGENLNSLQVCFEDIQSVSNKYVESIDGISESALQENNLPTLSQFGLEIASTITRLMESSLAFKAYSNASDSERREFRENALSGLHKALQKYVANTFNNMVDILKDRLIELAYIFRIRDTEQLEKLNQADKKEMGKLLKDFLNAHAQEKVIQERLQQRFDSESNQQAQSQKEYFLLKRYYEAKEKKLEIKTKIGSLLHESDPTFHTKFYEELLHGPFKEIAQPYFDLKFPWEHQVKSPNL